MNEWKPGQIRKGDEYPFAVGMLAGMAITLFIFLVFGVIG